MKKVLLVFAFVITSHISSAQTYDAAFKQDVMKMMEVSGAAGQYEAALSMILKNVLPEKQAALKADLLESIKLMQDKMAIIYMEEFTHDDIKEIIKYYESPAGKKFAEKSGIIFEKSQTAAMEWSLELQKIAERYKAN
jgi:hypothetical protein